VRRLLALVAVVAALAPTGCTGGTGPDTSAADPLRLVALLPTPAGMREAAPPHAVGAAEFAVALGGEPAEAGALADAGLRRAAVREWQGPGGARLLVAVGVWGDPDAARSVAARAAERPLGRPGARAWTPQDVAGSRGAQLDGAGVRLRTLSLRVGETGVYVRSEGPVADAVVVRLATLLATALGGEA
jgi:hypothetical protein